MNDAPKIYEYLERRGTGAAAFASFAILAADPDIPPADRADALWAMGIIARHYEPDLSMGKAGLPFFLLARKQQFDNIRACRDILSLYKEPPDGHDDARLASECLKILEAAKDSMSPKDRHYFDECLRSLAHWNVDIRHLRI